MTTNVNFDELAGKAFAPGATSDDYENLFAAVFSLDAWFFIADAEFQYKMPYCDPYRIFADAITLMVFTDGERARKFIAEGGLKVGAATNDAPEDLILRISTVGILDLFDKFEPYQITKIFFNPNKDSHGFHHDLKMMRPIYEHLESKGLLTKTGLAADGISENNLAELVEENADVIARFEEENKDFSYLIGASAAAMTMCDEAGKEQITSKMVEMFENRRNEFQMSPKLFRVYIESCLNEREFLLPTLAFAQLQQDKAKWQRLEQDAEFVKDYADWITRKLVPAAEMLMNEPVAPVNEESSAESGADFDELSKKAMATNAMEDLNALFGAAFALPKWNFISRGELPDVYPYVASNPAAADNQPMIRAFTDNERLMRFARENNLTEADGSAKVLTIPTENIISYLEGFVEQGAFGVWFNSDSESRDFFIPIKQLQPIKDHLAKQNRAAATQFTVLSATVTDGLMLPSGFVKKSTYNCNFFCLIPHEWTTEDLQIKPEYLEKLYQQFYGANWREGNSDGSRYVVLEANSAVVPPERIEGTKWNPAQDNELDRYFYYLGESGGAFKKVSADEFQAHLDAYFQEQKTGEARKRQDNSADFGTSQTADGDFDLNLQINQVGAVNFDASIAPFYEAIVPLLKDYRGTGDYVTLLRFEDSGKSGQVENIAENTHGAYLQIRRFLYLNPKNNTRIGVNSVHSNRLRHARSNAELLVSFELCKNLDNQTAAFYHAFRGPKADVLKLIAAIQPRLENCGYRAVK